VQFSLTAGVLFVLLCSLLGVVVAVGLILRTPAILRFMHAMNRWISMPGEAVTALEKPVPLSAAGTRSRALGVVLVALGAYSAVVLLASVDPGRVAAVFGLNPRAPLVGVALDAARWLLVLGGVAAIAAGLMLLFFPRAWRSLEAGANRWYSTRELAAAGDAPHHALDRLVQAFPRVSGWIILAMSLAAALASALLLLRTA
jgi:hypothetical protein